MRVVVPINSISTIVREIGGSFTVRGDDGIATFGDFHGWSQDCVFSLGPGRAIFVGEPITPKLQYGGSGNRLDPNVQDFRDKAEGTFQVYRLACEAMIVPTTKMHGEDAETFVQQEQASVSDLTGGCREGIPW